MPKCVNIQKEKRRICLGSLRRKVDIIARAQTFGNDDSIVDYGIARTTVTTVRADIQTLSGPASGPAPFDGVNTDTVGSHKITIKFLPDIDITNQVVVNGKALRILRVENMDEESQNLILFCSERGDQTLNANFS